MSRRTDTHRPSALVPSEYEYVAPDFVKVEDLGDALYLQHCREQICLHRARTGGEYSAHEHGGNCMVCGNANAIYTVLFYHEPTNSYVRMGQECARQVEMGGGWAADLDKLRSAVQDARARKAGKAKAEALLGDLGLQAAWHLVQDMEAQVQAVNEAHRVWRQAHGIAPSAWGDMALDNGKGPALYDLDPNHPVLQAEPRYSEWHYEERTIRDPKFAFFKRPAQAQLLGQVAA